MTLQEEINTHREKKLEEISNDIKYHTKKLEKLEMEYLIFKEKYC